MTGYLVDTNIPSELTRPNPKSQVEGFLRKAGKADLFISVLSIGEIRQGVAKLAEGVKRAGLEHWLNLEIKPWFGPRILPVTTEIAERWGEISAAAKAQGLSVAVIDGLIAATALEHDLSLGTRNVRHFDGLGVSIINPWEA